MGRRVRAYDWAQTPLGPVAAWPEALRSAVRLVLDMDLPAALAWGEALTLLHNDAFADLLDADPFGSALAKGGAGAVGALVRHAFADKASTVGDVPLRPEPSGAERVATLSLSPLRRDDGAVGGMLAIVTGTRTEAAARPHASPSFPSCASGGETGRAAEAVRASEEKYRTLFQTMEHGFSELELVRDAGGRAVDFRYVDLNPAFERLVGLPMAAARGRLGQEVMPGLEPRWMETYARVTATGVPERIEHSVAPLGRWYEASVFPQASDRVLVLYDDVTERKAAQAALREREKRQALLLALSDAVRPLTEPAAIQGEACRLLAEWLDVGRVYYAVIDETAGLARVERDHVRGESPSVVGEHNLADFAWVVEALRRGECHVEPDMQASAEVAASDRPLLAALRIAACMSAPLIKDGTLVAVLCVTHPRPRLWTADDVELLREVAERLWAAVERGRAETDIRHKNAALEGINRIFREALTASTEEELGRACLAIAEEVTGSAFSFMGEINPETGRFDELSISDRGWQHFTMADPAFPKGKAPVGLPIHGIYGRVLRDGRGLIANDPRTHPDRIGTPPGHPPLKAFLGVPLERDGRAIGMIGLGNRDGGYRPEDLEAAEALAPAILQALLSRRTADTLRESEERLRNLTELVPSFLWHMDPGGKTTVANQQWYDYTGQPTDAVRDGGWAGALHPDDRDETWSVFAGALATGQALERQQRIRRRDGTYRWFLVRHAPARDAEGRIVRWFGAATDIHDQYLAAETLRADEARQAFLLDLADRLQERNDPQATLRAAVDAIGPYFGVSRAGYARIYADGEIIERQVRYTARNEVPLGPLRTRDFGDDLRDRLHRGETIVLDDITGVQNRAYWEKVDIHSLLAVPLVRDGCLRAVFYLSHGEPRAWSRAEVALAEDVAARTWDAAERAQAETELRASEARQRALIEGIPQLVWRAEKGGGWSWASPQWCAYTGQSETESHGFGWLNALHPDDRGRAREAWYGAATETALTVDHRIRHAAKDRYRWFQTRALAVRAEGGIVEWLGTSTDIDDLRRLQEQQDVMVAELQHRTRNLITVVRSIAEQTMTGSASFEMFRSRFYARLALLSRVQGLLSRSNVEPITLNTLISTELDALGAWEAAERIDLEGPSVPLRKATVQTFALALHELATNARKYGALSGSAGRLQVTWRTYAENGRMRLALLWLEEGIERPAVARSSEQRGFGRELIEKALPYALDARTRYELSETALLCSIDMPLTDRRKSGRV